MASIVEEDEIDAKVLALKEEGNAFIKDARYSLAAERYTQAINLKPNAILYSNRAQAMIKMESYGLAIIDADKAIA
jgi:serine/threonine-protein phosphatase 5